MPKRRHWPAGEHATRFQPCGACGRWVTMRLDNKRIRASTIIRTFKGVCGSCGRVGTLLTQEQRIEARDGQEVAS